MPGVNLDFLPASQAPEVLGSPDSVCAESGLEEVIGDLLAQEEEDEEEQFGERNFEVTLRCAVGEIHSDLQAFGKRVDARLEEATAQVTPLAEAVARLQEENLRLRIHQERLVRQVEAMCKALGLPDPLLYELPSPESAPSVPCETNLPSSDSSACTPQDTALKTQHDTLSCSLQDPPSGVPKAAPPSTSLDIPSSITQEPKSSLQDLNSTSNETDISQTSEPVPSPVPHPPTFATRRSLSAPSLMANISCSNSMVLLSSLLNGSDHDHF